ncbi:MAG TPA: DUF924 family protein [Burkholderiaceae bacterium]|nr:DUF924 family protein [Burkholderiaceae bacterium]
MSRLIPPPAQAVLDYWFDPADVRSAGGARRVWFEKSEQTDAEIRARFGALVEAALAGSLDDWADTAHGALALVVLLDQFPRNLHRGTAAAFAGDGRALALARRMVQRGWDRELSLEQRWFAYLPFEHSEHPEDQRESLRLFAGLAHDGLAEPLVWAERHAEVIARFGRYPHRNAVLGRTSTPAEVDYLKQPGSGF